MEQHSSVNLDSDFKPNESFFKKDSPEQNPGLDLATGTRNPSFFSKGFSKFPSFFLLDYYVALNFKCNFKSEFQKLHIFLLLILSIL